MRCYSHLSDDEREQIGLAEALGPFDWRDRPSDRPFESTVWRELSRNRLRAGATRRFKLPEPINCAGGMKRGSKQIEPYGQSLSVGSRKGGPPSKFVLLFARSQLPIETLAYYITPVRLKEAFELLLPHASLTFSPDLFRRHW
jgi:hypothetical protein